jgi:hypothetical protein
MPAVSGSRVFGAPCIVAMLFSRQRMTAVAPTGRVAKYRFRAARGGLGLPLVLQQRQVFGRMRRGNVAIDIG